MADLSIASNTGATVHRLRRASPATRTAANAAREARRATAKELKAQRWSAGLLGVVAAVLTGLSLTDLASGIALITHASQWQSYALAVGIDIGMASTEFAALTAGSKVRQETRWYSGAMLGGTLALSACMNAFEFASQAGSLPFQTAGVVFGIAVPAAVFSLIRQAVAHYLDSHRRS
jgi:hypothetical protein